MSENLKSYDDYHDLRNDGRIVLYKRKSHKRRPSYNVRIKFPEVRGYIIKSTKSSDLEESKLFANNLYWELEGKLKRGESLKRIYFKQVIGGWKTELEINARGNSKKNIENNLIIFRKYITPFFNNVCVDDIDDDLIFQFMNTFHNSNFQYSPQSIRHYASTLSSILKYLKRKKYIQNIPEIPLPKLKINPRPDFTTDEWRKLYLFMRKHVNQINQGRIYRSRFYLQQAVLILANTGMRIGELRKIKWKDIEQVKDEQNRNTIKISVSGKTGSRTTIANLGTNKYFEKLYDFRKKELGIAPDKDEYVFYNNLTNQPIHSFRKSFNTLLESCGLMYNKDNQKRSIYSLRHTYVTMRLTEGVNIYQLANNIGSSVEMIERFYGKKRVSDPKNVSELTKSNIKVANSSDKYYPWR